MAEFTFEDFKNSEQEHSRPNYPTNKTSVGYFSLKGDGDEAIVRIMHDSTDTFQFISTHDITVDGKYRTVNCLRTPKEPISNCPLCEAGEKFSNKLFIRLIEYVRNDKGEIVALPKVWTRSASYAKTLSNLIDEYGPLSDCIFKIKRKGQPGSKQTTYDLLFGNPNIYRPELYPKLDNLFADYKPLGRAVLNKSEEELKYFVEKGEFPQTDNIPLPEPPAEFNSDSEVVQRPQRY